MGFFWISVSIIDRDRYLEFAVSRVDNANYMICFQDKTSILPFLLVFKNVLKIKKKNFYSVFDFNSEKYCCGEYIYARCLAKGSRWYGSNYFPVCIYLPMH